MTEIKPIDFTFFQAFLPDKCNSCGECLTHCPIIKINLKEAQNIIQQLRNGEESHKLLQKCQSCFPFELVRMAAGEDLTMLEKAHIERAWDIISIISVHLFTSIFRKNFKITQIATEVPIRKKSHFLFLRSFRWLLSFNWIRRIFRAIFKKLVQKYQKRKEFH